MRNARPSLRWSKTSQQLVLILCLGAMCAGCKGSDQLKVFPVRGTVTFNGQPLAGATITFTPKTGRSATGTTDGQGKFTLTTYRAGDGAVAGPHTVTLEKYDKKPPKTPGGLEELTPLIPERYAQASSTDQTATVKTDGENAFEFTLTD